MGLIKEKVQMPVSVEIPAMDRLYPPGRGDVEIRPRSSYGACREIGERIVTPHLDEPSFGRGSGDE